MYFSLDMYLQSMIFWFYTLLLAIYIRNFAYLCIMVWIHIMHMNIYVFFENMNVLCIFAQPVFLSSLFPNFCLVPVPRVGRFNHRFGSDNIALKLFLWGGLETLLWLKLGRVFPCFVTNLLKTSKQKMIKCAQKSLAGS